MSSNSCDCIASSHCGHTEAYFNSRTGAEPALSNAPAASSRAALTSSRAVLFLDLVSRTDP